MPKREDRSKHPVLPPNRNHRPFVLGAVCKETSVALERHATHGQFDRRCLLNVAHPLAVDVRGADVEPVAIQNEPDRNFMGQPALASIMGQPCRLLSGYPPQSRKFGRFHKLSSANFITNEEKPKRP